MGCRSAQHSSAAPADSVALMAAAATGASAATAAFDATAAPAVIVTSASAAVLEADDFVSVEAATSNTDGDVGSGMQPEVANPTHYGLPEPCSQAAIDRRKQWVEDQCVEQAYKRSALSDLALRVQSLRPTPRLLPSPRLRKLHLCGPGNQRPGRRPS